MKTKKHLAWFSLPIALVVLITWMHLPRDASSWSESAALSDKSTALSASELPLSRFAPLKPDRGTKALVSKAYGNLPLSFEANRGQTESEVKFISRGRGHSLFLTSTEAVLRLSNRGARTAGSELRTSSKTIGAYRLSSSTDTVLRMRLVGANPESQVSGLEELPGKLNYFIGNDPKNWHTNISAYAKVKYRDVYPGVDLIYHGNQRQLEYDFVVAPGADPSAIHLEFKGIQQLRISKDGDLVLQTTAGKIRQHKPMVYQDIEGTKREIASRYTMLSNNRIGFQVAEYDANRPLLIDPVVFIYSTYLGGNASDGTTQGLSIAVDASGNAYVTGTTISANFPTTPGVFQTGNNGGDGDVFVTKLNPTGTGLVYSTYLGGSGFDAVSAIAVDADSNAYVTGGTNSADFPTTPGSFQTPQLGTFSVIVTKLNPTGTSLVFSTYFGGGVDIAGNRRGELGSDIAVDASGNAYVTGATLSTNFPTTSGAFQSVNNGGGGDVFVTKLNPTGAALVYSTYLGGNDQDYGYSVAADTYGNAYVTGNTNSADFPTTPGAFQTVRNGGGDAFVTKLNPTGTALVYSTYFGSSRGETGRGILVDASGNAYVTGFTTWTDFPTTPGAFQTTFGGGSEDSFVTKLNPTGTALVYSTYLGGSGSDQSEGRGIAIDTAGNAYVTGNTDSTNFPTANPFQSARSVDRDAFVTKLNSTGTALVYSTYLGGNSSDYGIGVAVDTSGNAYVAGITFSTNFPTTPGAVQTAGQTNNGNNSDGFVVKISGQLPDTTPPVISCPVDISVVANIGGSCSAAVDPGVATATDNSSNVTVAGTRGDGQMLNALYSPGTTTITWTATDASGNQASCHQSITVSNPSPVATITGPSSGAVYAVDTPVNFTSTFTDNQGGTHTGTWLLDSITQSATVVESSGSTPGSANTTYIFRTAGVYLVSLTIDDGCGGTSKTDTISGLDAMVVIYDPNGGFVTGGGWFNSPSGAYVSNPSLAARANFGFVSKYQKGASIPTGETEFQFKLANLNFHSTAYEWLVTSGAKAQYKGSGTINGNGNYGFMLTAIDGQTNGGGGVDKFRIKIWDKDDGGAIIYDNQLGMSDTSDPTTAIVEGSIVIHK
jgi:hypothetical protein